jgi:hypothetical protein
VLAVLCAVVIATAAPAAAAPGARGGMGELAGASLTGCRGELVSRDAAGATIDRAVGEPPHRVIDPDDGEPTFTRSHPFEVVSDGDVIWSGSTTTVITDQSHGLMVWGFELTGGSAANTADADTGEGTFDLDGLFPVAVTGLVKGNGELTGSGGECLAAGWVRFGGSPVGSLLWFAAVAATLLGVGLVVLAQPRLRPAREAG